MNTAETQHYQINALTAKRRLRRCRSKVKELEARIKELEGENAYHRMCRCVIEHGEDPKS